MPGDPSLDLQAAIRARLLACADLVAIIPARNLMIAPDSYPERKPPYILAGEGQTVYRRWDATVYQTLHVWTDTTSIGSIGQFSEPGLVRAKTVCGLIVDALRVDAQRDGVLTLDNFICLDLRVENVRHLYDPNTYLNHSVLSVAGIMREK